MEFINQAMNKKNKKQKDFYNRQNPIPIVCNPTRKHKKPTNTILTIHNPHTKRLKDLMHTHLFLGSWDE